MASVQRVREKFVVGEEYNVKPQKGFFVEWSDKWNEEAGIIGRDKCVMWLLVQRPIDSVAQ